MGNASTKKQRQKLNRYASVEDIQRSNDEDLYEDVECGDIRGESRLDMQILDTIRKDLLETPELFVLNNMLMAVMFFEDYARLMEETTKERHEKTENCIYPDKIFERVDRNVRYRPLHGEKKLVSESIAPRRLYALNHVVKVYGATEEADKREKCAVRIEESRRKGFVRLREVVTSQPHVDVPVGSDPASRSSPDSDNVDYATFANIRTPKPIDISRSLERQENLPKSCVAYRKEKNLNIDGDVDLDEITEDDLYATVSYVSSRGFNRHFQTNLFPNKFAEGLGFDEEDVRLSRGIPGKVFCNKRSDDGLEVPFEVIPSIDINWPGELTLEFLMKSQRVNGLRRRVIFPTPLMIGEIKKLGCVVVPKGYLKRSNRIIEDSELEWELCFPQAEKFLESYMQHSQMKCLLFLLTIHKSFIESKTNQLGLLPEHIRTFMLWECENNYSDWPEHRLGTKMMKVIKNLNAFVTKGNLPDYFVKEKNHLDGIPKKYLRHAQKVFHDILESPLMHFVSALRNLRYARGKDFYPPLDFDRLREILKHRQINQRVISTEVAVPSSYKSKDVDSETKWRQIEVMKRKQLKLKKEEEKEKENDLIKDERKGSVDSIDLDSPCEKSFDIYKKRNLLKFFIELFIDIAQKSQQIASAKFARFYLKQARYLTKLLREQCSALGDDVDATLGTIAEEERKLLKNKGRAKVKRSVTLKDDSMMETKRAPRKTVAFIDAAS